MPALSHTHARPLSHPCSPTVAHAHPRSPIITNARPRPRAALHSPIATQRPSLRVSKGTSHAPPSDQQRRSQRLKSQRSHHQPPRPPLRRSCQRRTSLDLPPLSSATFSASAVAPAELRERGVGLTAVQRAAGGRPPRHSRRHRLPMRALIDRRRGPMTRPYSLEGRSGEDRGEARGARKANRRVTQISSRRAASLSRRWRATAHLARRRGARAARRARRRH